MEHKEKKEDGGRGAVKLPSPNASNYGQSTVCEFLENYV